MTITLYPSTVSFSGADTHYAARDARTLLRGSCGELFPQCGEIFQSSFAPSATSSADRFAPIDLSDLTVNCVYNGNGFVSTAVTAYSHHHHLVLRPDDVWIAILTQFNLYVNGNAELLRHLFVSHEGKKPLVVNAIGSRYTVDFGAMAESMGHLIQENVKDPELRKWIVPDFSTTDLNDIVVSSVIMMSTLKSYFSYEFALMCGLPMVTLLGDKGDWEKLLTKAEKLPSYGAVTAQWYALLKPVLAAFVRSFDEPDSNSTKAFWQSIAHHDGGGSGPTFLSGWITAFCFFDKKGLPVPTKNTISGNLKSLVLGGAQYRRIDSKHIPPAYTEVDVKLNDNGVVFETIMVAGHVGMQVSSSGLHTTGDTVNPVVGWWLVEKLDKPQSDGFNFHQEL